MNNQRHSSRYEDQRATQSAQPQNINNAGGASGEQHQQGGLTSQLGSHQHQAGYQQPYNQQSAAYYSPYHNYHPRFQQTASTYDNTAGASTSTSTSASPTASVLPNNSGYPAQSGSSLPYHFDYQQYSNRAGNPYSYPSYPYHPYPSSTYAYSQPPYHSLPQSSSGSLATYNNHPYPVLPSIGSSGYSYNRSSDYSGPSSSRATDPEQKDDSFYEHPTASWEDFQQQWRTFIQADESEQYNRYLWGELPEYASQIMAARNPTYDDCEDLLEGLIAYSRRVTVDRLKMIIAGINSTNKYSHVRVTGKKDELVARVKEALRFFKNSRAPEYFKIAMMIGEAQGYVYATSATASSSASSSSLAVPPSTSYGAPSSSSSTSTAVPSSSASTSTLVNGNRGAPSFGLTSSPGRSYSVASASTSSHIPQTQQRSGSLAVPAAARYQPAQKASTPSWQSTSYNSSMTNGAAARSTAAASIPTSWPTALPPVPKSNFAGQPAVPINFKPSPFFKIQMAVSPVVEMRKAAQGDKLTATAAIQLTDDQRQKLLAARNDSKAPQYQLRLYACSEDHYKPNTGYGSYGTVTKNTNVPIEFPGACEAKTNGYAVVANLKGIKKKPGTAPPANVGSATIHGKESTKASKPSDYALRIDLPSQNNINRVELNYINTDKLHYMIVYFVEATGIDALVERLKTQKVRTKEDVVKSLLRQAEDPDLVATASSLSLKDPLSFMNMSVPIRSLHCVHLQCFDAKIYLTMMESVPTWLCPVCNRAMNPDDLAYDCFTEDIKKKVPSSVDTVIIEVDGTWRSEDNKYGTAPKVAEAKAAKLLRPSPNPSSVNGTREGSFDDMDLGTPLPDRKPSFQNGDTARSSLQPPAATGRHGKSKTPAEVIDLGDDDDDDDYAAYVPPTKSSQAAKSGLGNSGTGAAAGASKGAGGVIDLTLSDSDNDDDGDGGPVPYRGAVNAAAAQKRRADSDWEESETSRTRWA